MGNAHNSGIALPLTLTDLIKSLREILGLVADVRHLLDQQGERAQLRKNRKAAGSISKLRFSPTGMRAHLEEIAAGENIEQAQQAIGHGLRQTIVEVEHALGRLHQFQDLIREHFGLDAADRLDQLAHRSGSKIRLRLRLAKLSTMPTRSPDDKSAASQSARAALVELEAINSLTSELHDLIMANGTRSRSPDHDALRR